MINELFLTWNLPSTFFSFRKVDIAFNWYNFSYNAVIHSIKTCVLKSSTKSKLFYLYESDKSQVSYTETNAPMLNNHEAFHFFHISNQ